MQTHFVCGSDLLAPANWPHCQHTVCNYDAVLHLMNEPYVYLVIHSLEVQYSGLRTEEDVFFEMTKKRK